jgi:hypothetical protein
MGLYKLEGKELLSTTIETRGGRLCCRRFF